MGEVKVPLLNRELSWLAFNRRVLAEAESEEVPPLERLKFLGITASNLDEFLMIRVGALRQLAMAGVRKRSPDGMTPRQQLKAVHEQTRALLQDLYRAESAVLGRLRTRGVRIQRYGSLTDRQRTALTRTFERQIAPVLTPLAVDPGHPFPFVASAALNVAVLLSAGADAFHTAFIKIPRALPRFVGIPDTTMRFVAMEELIRVHAAEFFPGLEVREVVPFRVVRNADIQIREDEVEDLLESMEAEIRWRDRKEAVWLEVARDTTGHLQPMLQEELGVSANEVFVVSSLLKLSDLMEIYECEGKARLRDEPFDPRMPRALAGGDDILATIREHDVLLHRPYDSYAAVVELIRNAANDPDVVAIKQTLYRTEPSSVFIDALVQAAELGKQVTAIIELQARFDEARNIAWARRLEEAGVQVVYGMVGIKTHCKICLIIRREGAVLRPYVHLSTGNYNARTARLYTDLDLITSDPGFGDDAIQLMNLLAGYSTRAVHDLFEVRETPLQELEWKRFIVAPADYHAWVLRMIEREGRHARHRKASRIVAQLNSLVDPRIIAALYRAADAGVEVTMLVRGICCLVPRPNIRVYAIIDRFLEHARIMTFANDGDTEVYVSSGDWMPRNFFRRIEVTWPILDPAARERVERRILDISLADDTKAWKLNPDGTYVRRRSGSKPVRSQQRFIELARSNSVREGRYEDSIARAGSRRKRKARARRKL
jgi:polyphosphate kinase